MVGRSVIDRVQSHFEQGRTCLEVPEWGEDPDNPLKIYSTPLTLREKKRIVEMTSDNNEATARVVILKACDEKGDAIFDIADLQTLMRKADADVLERICLWISSGVNPGAVDEYVEEAAGN